MLCTSAVSRARFETFFSVLFFRLYVFFFAGTDVMIFYKFKKFGNEIDVFD
jgi:hypothetical protein